MDEFKIKILLSRFFYIFFFYLQRNLHWFVNNLVLSSFHILQQQKINIPDNSNIMEDFFIYYLFTCLYLIIKANENHIYYLDLNVIWKY